METKPTDRDVIVKKPRLWRRYLLLSVAGLLFIGLGPYLYSRLAASSRICRIYSDSDTTPRASNFDPDSLSVVIFNIAHGRGPVDSNLEEGGQQKRERIQRIAEFLQQTDADIIILNEVDFSSTWSGHQNQAQAIAAAAGYPFRGEQRNLDFRFIYGSWKFGNAILSRFPISSSTVIDYPPVRWWEPYLVGKKRGAMFSVKLPNDQTINVVPVHLEHRSEEARFESANNIIEAVSQNKAPTVVGGDFNSTPTGMSGTRSVEGLGNTIDLLNRSELLNGPTLEGTDNDFTYPSDEPRIAIDWIFTTQNSELIEHRVIQSDLSDHLPVLARIRLDSATKTK